MANLKALDGDGLTIYLAAVGTGTNADPLKVEHSAEVSEALLIEVRDRLPAAGVSQVVSVTNLPATQPVSGSVAVNNLPTIQPVSGDFYLATQPVSGSVAVNNLPTIQPVSLAVFDTAYLFDKDFSTVTAKTIKASAGSLYFLYCRNLNAAARYIQLFNLAVLPASGAVPEETYPVFAGSILALNSADFGLKGRTFTTGITWAFSTTELIYTAAVAADQITQTRYL